MKNSLIIIILLATCSTHAQTVDERETVKQLNQSVVSAYKNQNYDDTLKPAQQALDLSVKIFGANDAQTAVAYTNLGIVYREKKKYKEAIENLQKALSIYQATPTVNGKQLPRAFETLASAYSLGGKEKEAEANYLKAFEASETIFGKDGKDSLQYALALAIFYARNKNIGKADEYFLRSYALTIKYFGADSKEFDTLSVYEKYHTPQSNLRRDNDPLADYKKKKFELLGYELGDATSLPQPAYTARGKSGRIVIRVQVDEQGNVTDAKAVYGEMAFANDCEAAARKAKFKPSLKNGKPISVVNYIAYNFII